MVTQTSIMDFSPGSSSNLLALQAQIDQISSHLNDLLRNLSSASAEQIEAIRALATASQTTLAQAQSDFAHLHRQLRERDEELAWKSASLARASLYSQPRPDLAMRARDLEAARVLLEEEESSLNGNCDREETKRLLASRLLHSAASIGFDEGLRYLLTEKHAHIDTRNQRGETPLQVALASQLTSTIALLLYHGASLHTLDVYETLLKFMVETLDSVEAVRSLLECGPDLNDIVFVNPPTWSNDKSQDQRKNRHRIATLFHRQRVREVRHSDWDSKMSGDDKIDVEG